MIEITDLDEIEEWLEDNFPNDDRATVLLGLVEEVGELCRTQVKSEQGIRGSEEQWYNEAKKELGDVFIKLVHVALVFDVNLQRIVRERFAEVSARDINHDALEETSSRALFLQGLDALAKTALETYVKDVEVICPACATAGDINAAMKAKAATGTLTDEESVRAVARIEEKHSECEGCDCQHAYGIDNQLAVEVVKR